MILGGGGNGQQMRSRERFEFASETSWVAAAVAVVRVVVMVVVGGACNWQLSSHTAGGTSCGSPKVFVYVCVCVAQN